MYQVRKRGVRQTMEYRRLRHPYHRDIHEFLGGGQSWVAECGNDGGVIATSVLSQGIHHGMCCHRHLGAVLNVERPKAHRDSRERRASATP
jgi:hypothetical protein